MVAIHHGQRFSRPLKPNSIWMTVILGPGLGKRTRPAAAQQARVLDAPRRWCTVRLKSRFVAGGEMTQLLGVFFLADSCNGFLAGNSRLRAGLHRAAQRRHRSGERGFRGPGSRTRGKEGAQLVVLRDRHARRTRLVDAPDHQGHSRLAGSGRRVCRTERRPRRQRRNVHSVREPHRGDGAGYQSRCRDTGQYRCAFTPWPSPAPKPTIADDKGKGERVKRQGKGDKGKGETGATLGQDRGSTDTLTRKQLSDAAAYIRAFAQMRGRNAEWAERAVREGVSLSAEEALAQKVIDLTARDVPELLAKLDGRKVTTAGGERTLATAGVGAGHGGDRLADAVPGDHHRTERRADPAR